MKAINKAIACSLPWVPKPIVAAIAKRYVAGETLTDAVKAVRDFQQKGILATLDILGEEVKEKAKAFLAVSAYRELLDTIKKEQLTSHISVKLTQLGLKINPDFCQDNLRELLKEAEAEGIFLRVDMEDSTCTDATIAIFTALKKEFENLGLVLQAYLRRTSSDLNQLLPLKPNIRLCKGIYVEKRKITFQDPQLINQNFISQMEKLLNNGCYLAIATHDEKLVLAGMQLAEKLKLGPENYEFQMLLGVDPELREIIISQGYRLRVYLPFGREWYGYCLRRLRENPAIAGYVMKQLLGIKSGGQK